MNEFLMVFFIFLCMFFVFVLPWYILLYFDEVHFTNDYFYKFRKPQIKRLVEKQAKYHSNIEILEKLIHTTTEEWKIKYIRDDSYSIFFPLSKKLEVGFSNMDYAQLINLNVKNSGKQVEILRFYQYNNRLESKDIFTKEEIGEEKEAMARAVINHLTKIRDELINESNLSDFDREIAKEKAEKESKEQMVRSLHHLLSLSEIERIKHYDQDGVSCRITSDDKTSVKLTVYVKQKECYAGFYFQKDEEEHFESTVTKEICVIDFSKIKLDIDLFARRIGKTVLLSHQKPEKDIELPFINGYHESIEINLAYLKANKDDLSFESLHIVEETIPTKLTQLLHHHLLLEKNEEKEKLIDESLHDLLLITNTLRNEVEDHQMKKLKVTHQIIENMKKTTI